MQQDALRRVLGESLEMELPALVSRDLPEIDLQGRKVVTLTGPRRSGKTYCFFDLMQRLQAGGVPRDRLVYVNFEDERILPFRSVDFDRLVETYFALRPDAVGKPVYFFLDEIQNVRGWEVAVRRLADRPHNRILLTGSSSRLLSRDIATALRGRTISYGVLPFSLSEMIRARGVVPSPDLFHSSKRHAVRALLTEYLEYGGFPEVVLSAGPMMKIRILQEYFGTMLFRDLVERFAVRNVGLLRELMRFLISNAARQFSVSAFTKVARQTFRVTKRTVLSYCDRLEDVGFVSFIPKFASSLKEQMVNPRKAYPVDPGFRTAAGFAMSEDRGPNAELAVFLRLRQLQIQNPGLQLYYWRTARGAEVDFIVKNGQKLEAIQVCVDPSRPEVRKRELAPLVEFLHAHRLRQGTIVTEELEDRETVDRKRIVYRPLGKWLLGH